MLKMCLFDFLCALHLHLLIRQVSSARVAGMEVWWCMDSDHALVAYSSPELPIQDPWVWVWVWVRVKTPPVLCNAPTAT